MILFALFVKMSNGATYSVVPFINNKALGTVSGIVGAGGNAGAVMAGFLFKMEGISYREGLLIVGIVVASISFLAFLIKFPSVTSTPIQPQVKQSSDEVLTPEAVVEVI
jgi:NNP family nitrate/nitrite transporter-like MFS transporter